MEEKKEKDNESEITIRTDIDINVVLRYFGKLNKWQIVQSIFILILLIPYVFTTFSMMFVGSIPPYRCSLPVDTNVSCQNSSTTNCNITAEGQCTLRNLVNNETSTCLYGYHYEGKPETSIVSQWNLVCNREYMLEMTQLSLTLGQTTGSFIISILAEVFGRKPVFIATALYTVVAQVAIVFSPDIVFYTVFRFLSGFGIEGAMTVSYVLSLENFPSEYVTYIALTFCTVWSASILILPGIAKALSLYSWRYMHAFVAAYMVYVFYQMCIMTESLRWMLAVGRSDQAVKLLRKISKINKVPFDSMESYLSGKSDNLNPHQRNSVSSNKIDYPQSKSSPEDTETKSEQSSEYKQSNLKINSRTCLNKPEVASESAAKGDDSLPGNDVADEKTDIFIFFRHPKLRYSLLAMIIIWPTNALTYFGLILMTANFSGDPYINFVIGAIVELIGIPIYIIFYKWFGNKKTSIIWHFVCSLLLVISIVFAVLESVPLWLVTVFSILARMSINTTFIAIFLWTPLMFPTPVRVLGTGICFLASSIGYIMSSYATYFARQILWGPPLVFCITCLLSAFLSFIPPETKNREMPQTIDEYNKLYETDEREKYKPVKV